MHRHALLIACTRAPTKAVKKVSKSRAETLLKKWSDELRDLGQNSFGWNGTKNPKNLLDPTRGKFTDALDSLSEIDVNDELFLYYFGTLVSYWFVGIGPCFRRYRPGKFRKS